MSWDENAHVCGSAFQQAQMMPKSRTGVTGP
jgi:hypothetical protein